MEKEKKVNAIPEDELAQAIGGTDIDTRKDLYENIILRSLPEEHNVMQILRGPTSSETVGE